jgi:hypothetical protein
MKKSAQRRIVWRLVKVSTPSPRKNVTDTPVEYGHRAALVLEVLADPQCRTAIVTLTVPGFAFDEMRCSHRFPTGRLRSASSATRFFQSM